MTKKMMSPSVPSTSPQHPASRFNPSTMFQPSGIAVKPSPVPPEVAMHDLLPHNQQLVRFILAHQPITAATLVATYLDTVEAPSALLNRLTYLKGKRWLLKSGSGKSAIWTFNASRTPKDVPVRASRAAAVPAAPDPSRLVAPRCVNVMAGEYQPSAPQAQRPGSDDHTRLPSLRHGQRVPFTPGYIFF